MGLTDCSQKKEPLNKVVLRLKWITQAQFAGYYVAHYKGYYEDEGLDVEIKPGEYGKNPLKTVKNEVEEFGVQWASDLVAEGTHFISLANIVKDNGFVLISKKEKGIKTVSEFKGRKLATWYIGHEYQLYALLEKYGLKRYNVNFVSQKWDMTQFYNDEVDIASAQVYNELQEVYEKGFSKNSIVIYNLKNLGIDFPGQNIFTTKSYYAKNPDICKKIVNASIKGWLYAIDHPEEAVDIVLKYDQTGLLSRDFQLKQMKIMISLIEADEYILGIHLKEHYDYIIKTYEKYKIIKPGMKADNYFINDLILKE